MNYEYQRMYYNNPVFHDLVESFIEIYDKTELTFDDILAAVRMAEEKWKFIPTKKTNP